ncbi:hypothetical protein KM043_002846 [Ampulex compressa]|nr:hypothetical protein KM043_002846 [Ampulex compressa]
MMYARSIISAILLLMNVGPGSLVSQYPKLLVVSYDAFRYDYFERNSTPYMNWLKKEGTHVDYMMNIFVTKTFPNHHTMATGLYAETHGVVDSEIYDQKTGEVIKYSERLFHYDNNVLPIWTVNEKSAAERHSGTMMWPGSIFKYQGISPTYAQAYNITVPWEDRIDTLISWFTHPTNPINFGILYIEEPDYHGHGIGINGPEFNKILMKLDNITRYLHQEIERHGLKDLNVIHLSDHGMASVTTERIINLTKYINSTDYTFVGTSPGLHIYPNSGKEDVIYQKLKAAAEEMKTFKVYKKNEIPQKYHYSKSNRVGPIFVIAEIGYAFQNLLDSIDYYKEKFNITVTNKTEFGLHGYDNEAEEMHPFFFARGPAFLPNCKLEPFNNTDLFPLFCKILNVDCPVVNGTLSHFSKCLNIQTYFQYFDSILPNKELKVLTLHHQVIFAGIALAVMVIVGMFMMLYLRRKHLGYKNYRMHYNVYE